MIFFSARQFSASIPGRTVNVLESSAKPSGWGKLFLWLALSALKCWEPLALGPEQPRHRDDRRARRHHRHHRRHGRQRHSQQRGRR